MNKFYLLTFFTCFITSQIFSETQASPASSADNKNKNQPTLIAPQFKLPQLSLSKEPYQNSFVNLSDYKGKWLFINFWASWCTPCRKELPVLQTLYEKYKRSGIEILAISIDEEAAEALSAVKNLNFDFKIALDSTNSVSQQYKVSAMPTSYLVSPEGNIVKVFHGFKKGYAEKYDSIFQEIVKGS